MRLPAALGAVLVSLLCAPAWPAAAPAAPSSADASRSEPDAELTCQPDPRAAEATVRCSDGKAWTMRSAGLILPPVLRCSGEHPECCQIGYKLRDVQLADLVRAGSGQAPVCHMRVRDVLTNPPSQPAPDAALALETEVPPGLRKPPPAAAPATPAAVPPVPAPALALAPAPAPAPTPVVAAPAPCPPGQAKAGGGCRDLKALVADLLPPPILDRNRLLVPEAAEVVHRMRTEVDRSGRCPESSLDIGVLERIYGAAELRAELLAGEPLDTSPLVARAAAPGTAAPDDALPVSCGYNATFSAWNQTTFHCFDPSLCYAQSHQRLPHACVRFERPRDAAQPATRGPYLWPTANCTGVPSCTAFTSGSCTGVARLTALGEGIFLMVQLDARGAPYYYGVLLARRPQRSPEQAARAASARSLLEEIAQQTESPPLRAKLRQLLEAAAQR